MDRSLKEKKHPATKGAWNLHDSATNEPVMTVKPGHWGRETSVSWHPDFLEKHPNLVNSYEWGNPAQQGDHKSNSFKNRSEAVSKMNARYRDAAAAGFRDRIHRQHERISDEQYEKMKADYAHHHQNDHWTNGDLSRAEDEEKVRKVSHFSDPETNERIISHRYDATKGKHVFVLNPKYLDKHNIDREVASTLIAKNNDVYNKAAILFANKGKQAKLTGRTSTQGGGYHTFKVNTTPEEASQAHEAHICDTHKGIKIDRTSPTTFTGMQQPSSVYSPGRFVTSHVIGDILHTTSSAVHHPEHYDSKKNTQIIEQFTSDPVQYLINFIKEEGEGAPTNAASGGNVAGIGVGPYGEPGVKKKTYQQKNRKEAPSPVMSANPLKRMFANYSKE